MMNVSAATILNYGRPLRIVSIACPLSPSLTKKFSAVMEVCHQICRVWSRFDALCGPTDVPDQGLLCDLLWSDPDKEVMGWGENDRGVSFTFWCRGSGQVSSQT